jgi:hypothetical protein
VQETREHFLLKCGRFMEERRRFFERRGDVVIYERCSDSLGE